MARHTGNKEVLAQLQKALEAFLEDHRKHAESDPAWLKNRRPEKYPRRGGCGCEDCQAALALLSRVY